MADRKTLLAPFIELNQAFTRRRLRAQRASVMVEFAMVGPVFFLMLFVVFETAYDQFLQAVLESSLAFTARQMQIGTAQLQTGANNVDQTTPASFLTQYFCPNAFGLLNCNNLYVRVQVLNTTLSSAGCTDVYQSTTGSLPVNGSAAGNALALGDYSGVNGNGAGGTPPAAASPCVVSSTQGYCNPTGNEYVLLSAVYIAPSFINGLLPNTRIFTYNGHDVRGQFASIGFQTEDYSTANGATSSGQANPSNNSTPC